MMVMNRAGSVENAVMTHPDTTVIYRRNMATLRKLGLEGWHRLFARR